MVCRHDMISRVSKKIFQHREAGLHQSLFERLIFLGIRPVRLEVRRRMYINEGWLTQNAEQDLAVWDGEAIDLFQKDCSQEHGSGMKNQICFDTFLGLFDTI